MTKLYKTNYSKIIILLTTVMLFGSCTVFFLPKKQNITINPNNENTTVYVNNEEFGKGSTTDKVTKLGCQQVVLKTPGHRDQYEVLLPKKRVAAYWPLFVLDIPSIVLYGGVLYFMGIPKNFAYPKQNSFELTNRLVTKSSSDKYIQFEGVQLKVLDKDKDLIDVTINYADDIKSEIEKAEKKNTDNRIKQEIKDQKNKNKKKTLLTEEDKSIKYKDTYFSYSVYKTLNETGFIDTVNAIFLDQNNTLVLEGVIQKATTANVWANKGLSSYRKTKLYITWYLKNTFGEKLDSINDWIYSDDILSGTKGANKEDALYYNAVDCSLQELMKTSKFKEAILLDSNFVIKEQTLTIQRPTAAVSDANGGQNASVIIKRKDKGHGSGFAISNDGYILTNYHVIAGEFANQQADFKVVLAGGEEVEAKVVRYNKKRDVALLKVDAKFEHAFLLSNDKTFSRLMEVYAIGTPKSIELGQSVSIGILSNERKTNNNNLLQLNMSVNSGNSGGPLFDKQGRLQGIVTSKLMGFSTEGVSFAIPSYAIAEYLNIKIK